MRRNLILSALVLCGACSGLEEPGTPVAFPAPEDIIYDEVLSTSTSISLAWSASNALAHDAWNFVVELVESPQADSAVFSRRIKTYEPRPCNECRFTSLPEFGRYYVRVKACYEGGESAWAYFGDPSVIEAGTGRIEDTDTRRVREPKTRLKSATAGSLAVEWSVTDFGKKKIDRDLDYKVFLYRDAQGTDLEVAWTLRAKDNVFEGSQAGYVLELDHPAFKFTGLQADTPYWFKVTTGELSSQLAEYRTAESLAKVPDGQVVSEGEYALYEDFEEFIWGGDANSGSAGYFSLLRYAKDSFVKAEGDDPTGTEDQFIVCGQNNEVRLYECSPALIRSTRLKDWGRIVLGTNSSQVSYRAGSVRVGNDACGSIATAPLTNLAGKATILVEFDAKNYYIRESRGLSVEVVQEGKFDPNFFILSPTVKRTAAQLELNAGYQFQHYSVKIPNVAPGSRIAFTGVKDPVGSTSRFYLDNVSVKVLKYQQ